MYARVLYVMACTVTTHLSGKGHEGDCRIRAGSWMAKIPLDDWAQKHNRSTQ